MILHLQIPDEVWERYRETPRPKGVSPEELVAKAILDGTATLGQPRTLTLSAAEIDALEQKLAGGSLKSGADLLQKVTRLADLQIGKIPIDFTPGEWEELKRVAAREGRTLKQEVEQRVRLLHEAIFSGAA